MSIPLVIQLKRCYSEAPPESAEAKEFSALLNQLFNQLNETFSNLELILESMLEYCERGVMAVTVRHFHNVKFIQT